MSRKIAREVLMKLLYEKDVIGAPQIESYEILSEEFELNDNDRDYIKDILFSMDGEQNKIDHYIEKYIKDWTIDRISRVDLAIIRLAMYELLNRKDVPTSVAINEAVELAKKYSNEKSSSFINGILGNFNRTESIESEKD